MVGVYSGQESTRNHHIPQHETPEKSIEGLLAAELRSGGGLVSELLIMFFLSSNDEELRLNKTKTNKKFANIILDPNLGLWIEKVCKI